MTIKSVSRHLIDPGHPHMDRGSLIVSPNGQRVAYVTRPRRWFRRSPAGTKETVVVDGNVQKEYDAIENASLVFSPHSQRLAYVAKVGEKRVLVIGDEEYKPYDFVYDVEFSPNSQRFAYAALAGEKKILIIDGEERWETKHDSMSHLEDAWELDFVYSVKFSPDSRRVVYVANRDGEQFFVMDGEEYREWNDSLGLNFILRPDTRDQVFSPNGERTVAVVKDRDKERVLMNGKAHPRFSEIIRGTLVCSADGKRVAYVAVNEGSEHDGYVVVVDGKSNEETYGIRSAVVFSPDSQYVSYVAQEFGGFLGFESRRRVVIDNIRGDSYLDILTIAGRPDIFFDSEGRLHYIARTKDGIFWWRRP